MGASLPPLARVAPHFFVVVSLSVTERSSLTQGAHIPEPSSPSPREITAQIRRKPATCLVPRAPFGAPTRSNCPAFPTRIQREALKGDLCPWRKKACHLGCPGRATSRSERRSSSLAPNVGTPNALGDAIQSLRCGENVENEGNRNGEAKQKTRDAATSRATVVFRSRRVTTYRGASLAGTPLVCKMKWASRRRGLCPGVLRHLAHTCRQFRRKPNIHTFPSLGDFVSNRPNLLDHRVDPLPGQPPGNRDTRLRVAVNEDGSGDIYCRLSESRAQSRPQCLEVGGTDLSGRVHGITVRANTGRMNSAAVVGVREPPPSRLKSRNGASPGGGSVPRISPSLQMPQARAAAGLPG